LLDALVELILLAEPRRAPKIEQLALAGERLLDVGVVDGVRELRQEASAAASSELASGCRSGRESGLMSACLPPYQAQYHH